MNPDMNVVNAYAAGYARAKREINAKRAQSRAAQPRRRDNKKSRPVRAR